MQKYVAGFMFSEDRKDVVLIRKLNPAWQRGKLNGVGGKVESGETIIDAMVREFREETGVTTAPSDWQPYVTITDHDSYEVHFMYAVSGEIYKSATVEKEEVHICPVSALPETVIHNLRWLIPMALDKRLSFREPALVSELPGLN